MPARAARPPETDPVASAALAAAVATLTAALATKQEAATAGTDAEIAAAKAEVLLAVDAVQTEVDALEAAGATDAEVAAAVAALAATVATDAELAAHAAEASHSNTRVPAESNGGAAIQTLYVPKRAGYYYRSPGAFAANTAVTNQRVYWLPVFVPGGDYDRIIILQGTTLGSAGSVVRLGLYADDGGGAPGARLADYGTVDVAANASIEKLITIALTVPSPGALLWPAFVCQGGAPTTPTVMGLSGVAGRAALGLPANNLSSNRYGWVQDGVSGALPDPAVPVDNLLATPPVVALRRV